MTKFFNERIAMERYIVSIETPSFIPSDTLKGPCFTGWHMTSGIGSWYKLQLQLTNNFPNEKPILTIVSPKRLYKYKSQQVLNDIGTSHTFHINGTDVNGNLEICHTRNWDASKSCVGIIIKGCLWWEAYDYNLATGITIDDTLTKLGGKQQTFNLVTNNIFSKTLHEYFRASTSVPNSNFIINPQSPLNSLRYSVLGSD